MPKRQCRGQGWGGGGSKVFFSCRWRGLGNLRNGSPAANGSRAAVVVERQQERHLTIDAGREMCDTEMWCMCDIRHVGWGCGTFATRCAQPPLYTVYSSASCRALPVQGRGADMLTYSECLVLQTSRVLRSLDACAKQQECYIVLSCGTASDLRRPCMAFELF